MVFGRFHYTAGRGFFRGNGVKLTDEGKKSTRPLLLRLDKKTYWALKELSFYSETPMRDIVTSALNAYGLKQRVLEAKKEAGD